MSTKLAKAYGQYIAKLGQATGKSWIDVVEQKLGLNYEEYCRAKTKPTVGRSAELERLAKWYQEPLKDRLRRQALHELAVVLNERRKDLERLEDELDDLLAEELGAGDWA